jgi:hypothetical protein
MAQGHNLEQNMVSYGANMMVANIQNSTTRSFMSGFTNSFLQTVFDNQAEAQRQQQIIEQQLAEQRRRQQEEQRLAEQRRIDEMFARLTRELKLDGLPFNLTLKGMNSTSPDGLQLKSMSSSGPGDLHLKIGDANSTSYGLKGLPGIYVGGPAGGDPSVSNAAVAANASTGTSDGSAGGNPNLVNGPGTGTTGQGIPGLPGIYLDGVQPTQAPQLAQAAETLKGPERDLAEDTALHAAENNQALTAATQDPKVQAFQQADQDYQGAVGAETTASQQYEAAQQRVAADQSALHAAQDHLANLRPTLDQQAAMRQMLDVAKTDEAASEQARQMFENAQAHLSMTRTQASGALASLAPASSSATSDPSVVDLSHATHTQPNLLRASSAPASAPASPVRTPVASVLHASPKPSIPTQTIPQLCAQLTGAQDALRRLMETQKMHNEVRAEWEKTVNDASDDALQRGLDMVREWGGEAFSKHLEKEIAEEDKAIEKLYRDISVEKDPAKVGEMQKHWQEMDLHKAKLEDALKRTAKDQQHLKELAEERDVWKWNKENEGSLADFMDGFRQVTDILVGDENVQHRLGISSKYADYYKYSASIVDSAYDITGEVLGWRQIEQLNQNSDQYLQAVNALHNRIQKTVDQLKLYKAQNSEGVRCNE